MKSLSSIVFKALNKSRGVAEKVAFITVCFAVIAIVMSMSIASGFRSELTSIILDKEGYYWLEYRDGTLSNSEANPIDSNLISDLYAANATKVEPRISSQVIILSDNGSFPIEIRSTTPSNLSGLAISSNLARKLNVKVGDSIDIIYSMQIPFTSQIKVDSIFECGIKELSESIGYSSSETVSRLRRVDAGLVDGYVVWGGDVESIADLIYPKQIWMYDSQERFSGIFDWLDVIDGNVWLVVIIMIAVAMINMLAASLSIVLENTKSIAILKSLGMPSDKIRQGLLMKSFRISVNGAVLGLIISVVLCALQYYLHIIKLPSSDYMVDSVPIFLDIFYDIFVTVIAVVIISLMTLFVSLIIDNIKEDKILRYE